MRPNWLLLAATLVACAGPESRSIPDKALVADPGGENWLAFGRTLNEQRFSPLRQVDTTTVAGLKVDWFIDLPDKGGLVSTPLVANGVMYFIGSLNVVRAVDATSGRLIWSYDPKVTEQAGDRMRVGWDHNRGIALAGQGHPGHLGRASHRSRRGEWARAMEHHDRRSREGALHHGCAQGLQGQGDHR